MPARVLTDDKKCLNLDLGKLNLRLQLRKYSFLVGAAHMPLWFLQWGFSFPKPFPKTRKKIYKKFKCNWVICLLRASQFTELFAQLNSVFRLAFV